MALLNPSNKKKKEQVRLNIDSDIWNKVKAYCDWAGFSSKEDFVEQAIEFILKKDRDWKKLQTNHSK